MIKIDATPASPLELVLSFVLDAPRAHVYRAWTDPELIKQWFAPLPWTTSHAESDLRSGGSSLIVMKSPEGQEFPMPGVYLEVVAGRKLVFTDAFSQAWTPAERAFMVGEVTFEDAEGGATRYTARIRHWTAADHETHLKMGFEAGWTKCAQQLENVAKKL